MIKIFEMFTGYGGASWALKKANIDYECVGISEIDKYAIQCFNQNFPNIKNYGDCSKIKTKTLPDFDLLTGGFPCQDVSIAGKRDLNKGRTNLYLEVLRIAKDKKPKYMLLENVKGLLSMKVNERNLQCKIISDLNKIGYDVCFKLLNSKDYGIPQNRERVWFVCKLGKWNFGEFMFPKKNLKIKGINILDKNIDEQFYLNEEKVNKINRRSDFGDSIINIEKMIIQKHMNKIRTYFIHFPTLTCIDTQNIFIKENNKLRNLTLNETFKLMGFINDEINLNNLTNNQCYKLAGNGWDINLASKLFKEMFKNEKNIK